MVGILGTVALSMHLMIRIGQLSFAQVAFMGIGAYASALTSMKLGLNPAVAFVGAGVLTAAIALLLGPIFLRIKGVYFVLLTFAFSQIVNLVFQDWTSLFGGNNGLYGIPKMSIFGLRMTAATQYYVFAMSLLAVAYVTVSRIHRSDIGAIISALDENEKLGNALGLNSLSWRVGIFVISSFFAGLAGSLYAHYIGFLSPGAFAFTTSVDTIVMNVIGGAASPIGPLVGAILLVPLPELLREAKQYQLLTYGIILVVVLLFFRDGLVGFIQRSRSSAQ
jgi:branched-chain amino acid transport system permease protein